MAFLAVARYLAAKSEARMRHGAVLVRSGNVIGTGFNKSTNHPSIVSSEHIRGGCSRHAEMEAIRDAGGNARRAVLYVARINKAGQQRNSLPCKSCAAAIARLGIKRIVYTVDDNAVGMQRNGLIYQFEEHDASKDA